MVCRSGRNSMTSCEILMIIPQASLSSCLGYTKSCSLGQMRGDLYLYRGNYSMAEGPNRKECFLCFSFFFLPSPLPSILLRADMLAIKSRALCTNTWLPSCTLNPPITYEPGKTPQKLTVLLLERWTLGPHAQQTPPTYKQYSSASTRQGTPCFH